MHNSSDCESRRGQPYIRVTFAPSKEVSHIFFLFVLIVAAVHEHISEYP